MKNKDKYNLTELIFKKKKASTSTSYLLIYCTEVYYHGELVDTLDGGSFSDRLVWLESEEKCKTSM